MAEHEKELLEKMAKAIPHLSDYEKGYINGVADNAVEKHKEQKKTEKKEVD